MNDLTILEPGGSQRASGGGMGDPIWNLIKTRFLIFPKKIFIGLRSGAI
jgi:hypothetical protein